MEHNSKLRLVNDIQEVLNPCPAKEEDSSPTQLGMASEYA